MLDPRTVSNTYVRTLLAVLQARGVSTDRLCAHLGVEATGLEDPDGRCAAETVRGIWQHGLALTGDPLLGLAVAEAARPTTFRALGLAAMTSATLQAALKLMLRYYRLVSECGALHAQPLPGGDVSIVYTEQLQRLTLFPQQVEAIVGGILVMARGLAERPLTPVQVTLRHPPQGQRSAYRRLFGVDVQFNATANQLQLQAADLTHRLPQSDPGLHRVHCELLDQQWGALPRAGSISAYARQWLAARASGAMRVDDLAQALGMSLRALQRQLHQENQSWTTLVDTARRDTLQQLLREGVPLQEAARRMGYHDASSLSRAAKRWFGKTPGEWQRSSR